MKTFSFLRRWFGRGSQPGAENAPGQSDPVGAEAQFQRGLRFAAGQGDLQDYPQAAHWYMLAASQNHSLAQFNLAIMYQLGQGVARDKAESLLWMTRSANLGDAAAQYALGLQRHRASQEPREQAAPEGRIEALKWARLSAAQGYRGAERACELVAMSMTLEEVAEGARRARAFVAG